MKAMIFAAGLGTRLRPLTDKVPKAMVEVGGKPMLQRVIEHCIDAGYNELVINVHYLADQIEEFIRQKQSFGVHIHISDEREALLETGGGLWKAQRFLEGDEPFLLCNADVFTNIDLGKFRLSHIHDGRLATLAVRNRNSSRQLLFDQNGFLGGKINHSTGEKIVKRLSENFTEFAFSGYHIISPEIFRYPTRSGKFSITDVYLDLCATHHIGAYQHDDDIWVDIGNLEKLAEANAIANEAI
jgi:NDP-sugar pyrophosphorylase family protein